MKLDELTIAKEAARGGLGTMEFDLGRATRFLYGPFHWRLRLGTFLIAMGCRIMRFRPEFKAPGEDFAPVRKVFEKYRSENPAKS